MRCIKMVGIIAISHGSYAKALINSVEMIYGKQEKIRTICLEVDKSIESLKDKIDRTIEELNVDEVLMLVDILGGTPYNAACLFMDRKNVNIITGMNMPMILEIIPYMVQDLEKISSLAEHFGQNGVINIRQRYNDIQK
ncbi:MULTISPECIES: PTS sugar transporter subunit IIA [Clostridium]|nr:MULTISPECIES: PTS sugar transporter subunit IIA [Clostridium]